MSRPLLGGQFTSRINLNLRERHGFTYGARATWSYRRGEGPFSAGAGVFTAKTDSSVTEFLTRAEGHPRPALGAPGRDRDGEERADPRVSAPSRRPTTASRVVLCGAGVLRAARDRDQQLQPAIAEVTPEEVTRVANKYIVPENLAVVIVGDLAKIRPGMEALAVGPIKVLDADGKEVTP